MDSVSACRLEDTECIRATFNNMLSDLVTNGSPENGIPILDPYNITDFEVVYPDVLNATLIDGVILGLSNCIFDSFS